MLSRVPATMPGMLVRFDGTAKANENLLPVKPVESDYAPLMHMLGLNGGQLYGDSDEFLEDH